MQYTREQVIQIIDTLLSMHPELEDVITGDTYRLNADEFLTIIESKLENEKSI
jgi:hypothetical protein